MHGCWNASTMKQTYTCYTIPHRVATNYARRQPLWSGPCDLRPQFYDFPPFYLLAIHQWQTLISSMQISLHSKVTHSILTPQFFNETMVLKCTNHCTVICLHRKCQKIILANDDDDDRLFHEHIQCLIDGFKLTEREWHNGDDTLWPIFMNDTPLTTLSRSLHHSLILPRHELRKSHIEHLV